MPASISRRLLTPGYQCFSCKFGSFDQDQLAVATATNFGLKGPEYYYVNVNKRITPPRIDTKDALYDVAWSEQSPNIMVAGSADGSVLIIDSFKGIVNSWNKLHRREVNSVDWNMISRDSFLSGSFDGTVSIVNSNRGTVNKIVIGESPVYEACWNPRDPFSFVTVSGDCSIRIYDTRQPRPSAIITNAHAGEILCTDWNKYEPLQLATGSVDQQVKIWDLRSPSPTTPINNLSGHFRAVRRVKFSPFHRNNLASCGYDMTVRLWNSEALNPLIRAAYQEHTEFVIGLAFSLKRPHMLASCSWDDSIHFIDTNQSNLF